LKMACLHAARDGLNGPMEPASFANVDLRA
jgi:hypothetical protein